MSQLIRIIGDVHNLYPEYHALLRDADYSLQLGDLATSRLPEYRDRVFEGVDPTRHRFFPGNHDHYPTLPEHNLGDWGPVPFLRESFFIRGAYSIDWLRRQEGVDLFTTQEQLTMPEMVEVEQDYLRARPRYVFTHDAPHFLVPHATSMPHLQIGPSRTQLFLERLWERHRPEYWYFGHYHKDMTLEIGATRFQCLNILSYVDLVGVA